MSRGFAFAIETVSFIFFFPKTSSIKSLNSNQNLTICHNLALLILLNEDIFVYNTVKKRIYMEPAPGSGFEST